MEASSHTHQQQPCTGENLFFFSILSNNYWFNWTEKDNKEGTMVSWCFFYQHNSEYCAGSRQKFVQALGHCSRMTGPIFVLNTVYLHTEASTFQAHFIFLKNWSRHPGLVERSIDSYVISYLSWKRLFAKEGWNEWEEKAWNNQTMNKGWIVCSLCFHFLLFWFPNLHTPHCLSCGTHPLVKPSLTGTVEVTWSCMQQRCADHGRSNTMHNIVALWLMILGHNKDMALIVS